MKSVVVFLLILVVADLNGATFPPPLEKGDTIAIIAPASPPDEDQRTITEGLKKLVQRGYRVRLAPNLLSRNGYLAGTDEERAKAFMEAWLDPEVKAIWCYRGGYGCTRILDRLDFDAIREHPKIFIGMSDVTALHAALAKETDLVTYLGPNASDGFKSSFNEKELFRVITPAAPHSYQYRNPKTFPSSEQSILTLRSGVAKGRLVGGNLALVAAMIGTPWEVETDGNILVLEEVYEEPFRIDRMLQQLKQAGLLEGPSAVILCSWKGCKSKKAERSLKLERVFKDYFSNAPYPVLLGFPSGHIPDQVTLPLNAVAELDAKAKTLRLLERPVRE